MQSQDAYLLYINGLRQLMRRAAGASVDDAFRQLAEAWTHMSPSDRALVISKGGDIDSLLGDPPPEPEKVYEWHAVAGRRDLPRPGGYRPRAICEADANWNESGSG